MAKIRPLEDRVVIQQIEAEEKTAGGIVLPDTAKDKPQKGKVIAVGEGRITKDGKRRPLQVKHRRSLRVRCSRSSPFQAAER